LRSFCCHQQAADAIAGENFGAGRKPPVWVEHNACRMWPGDPPYRQQRIVGECRADANDDRID
jgi:hypothetical protein